MFPPTYHWLPEAELDVKTTEPPVQKVVAPPAEIVGLEGMTFIVTTLPSEGDEEQPLAETTTV